MRVAALVLVVLAIGCDGDIDPPWELDHDRIIAVRAEPPAINTGRSVIDALLTFKGGTVMELSPEAATVISPMTLMSAVKNDGGKWVVDMPPEAALAAARTELELAPGAAVPLQIGVIFNGATLAGLKVVWLGKTGTNPTLTEMMVDGSPLEMMNDLVVPKETNVRFSVSAIDDDDVNWLTDVGEMHDFDLPQSYLRVAKDEEMVEGELVLVKRDIDGGVVWRVWPIRAE